MNNFRNILHIELLKDTVKKLKKRYLVIYFIIAILAIVVRLHLYTHMASEALQMLFGDFVLLLAVIHTLYIILKLADTDINNNEARLAAERANEAKSQFLASMSHEIRTPINAIIGMNEMILREAEEENILDYAQNIESASTVLLGLVNDILDFSKIESGKMDIVDSEYELGVLINDLESMFKVRTDEKQLKLKFEIDSRLPRKLYGDPIRVKQICSNLLSNAVKYTDNGEIVFSVIGEREKDGNVLLTIKVTDTGKGIKKEDLELLWNKFQRVDLKNNNNIEGTGLGLAITKNLAERMKGSVAVESTYHSGSTFTVTIIQGVRNPVPLGDYRNHKKHSQNARETGGYIAPDAKILAVDDARLNLEVITALLRGLEAQIDTADSGEKCIEKCRSTYYDVIILDARMPRMSGEETLYALNSKKIPHGKVLALTADAMSGAREKYLEEGFDGYFSKPIKPEVLERAVTEAIPEQKLVDAPKINSKRREELPAWLYKCSDINPDGGLRMCGTAETYISTLISFSKYAKEHIHEMDEALSRQDLVNFGIKIHALKSSAKLIGANGLSEKARLLEDACNNDDTAYVTRNAEETLQNYMRIANILSPLLNDDKTEKKSYRGEIMTEDVPILFRHVKEYVEEFNDEALNGMLGNLANYKFPPQAQEKFEKLVKAHDAVDWALMMELLEEY